MPTYVCGDSHVGMFKGDPRFRVYDLGPATAHNYINPCSASRSCVGLQNVVSLMVQGDTLIICAGEIDCRRHLLNAAVESCVPVDRAIGITVHRFMEALDKLNHHGREIQIVVCGIPPPGFQANELHLPNFPTPQQHAEIYREFHLQMQAACVLNGHGYIDLYTPTVGKDGHMREEFTIEKDRVHLNKRALEFVALDVKAPC